MYIHDLRHATKRVMVVCEESETAGTRRTSCAVALSTGLDADLMLPTGSEGVSEHELPREVG